MRDKQVRKASPSRVSECKVFSHSALWLWSVLVETLRLLGLLFPGRLRRFFEERKSYKKELEKIRSLRGQHKHSVLFFCSSAGEYEQARPLLEHWQEKSVLCTLVFFSPSGTSYAKTQREQNIFFLSPLDTLWDWKALFEAAQPDATLVVRHELWPCFLHIASIYSTLYLLNASQGSRPLSRWGSFLRSHLLSYFSAIHSVSEKDAQFFKNLLPANSKTSIFVSGDSKFDRVIQRSAAKKDRVAEIKAELDRAFPSKPLRLTLGSAWPADVELGLEAFLSYKNANKSSLAGREDSVGSISSKPPRVLQCIIVPHQPNQVHLAEIQQNCQSKRLSCILFSELKNYKAEGPIKDVVIVDAMGWLCELYGASDLAFVGGAMHHQVHNVLEPASHGLSIAFGPLYQNSHEAIKLVEASLACSVRDTTELLTWITKHLARPADKTSVLQFLEKEAQASKKMISQIEQASLLKQQE